ncbi:MAG: DUF4982 domain-containing protein [Alteromonadaceae bacterium]|nr:DUF4982 domain-containing protein [Alteromonadaceae bacterium]
MFTVLAGCHTLSSQPTPFNSKVIAFNQGWQFKKTTEERLPAQINEPWQDITLPHTPQLEPEIVNNQWQGIAWYQKSFSVPDNWLDQAVFVRFEGAMNAAEIWLNDTKVGSHLGGYLPFTLNLSPYLRAGNNTLRVRLDNRDNDITGPKPLKLLDFNMYGGLYRDVKLLVKNKLMITDEMSANEVAGGGVFVTFPKVDQAESSVKINTHVANTANVARTFTLTQTLNFNGKRVQSTSREYTLDAGEAEHIEQLLTITQPSLWSPQHPHLYKLETVLASDSETIETQRRKIGIRSFVFNDQHELLINGKKTFLRGVNRHQEYPFVGYATSAQADYRDAVKIKSAGFDYVRLSHYPHSTAFMEAADELGLVLLDAILGWQYYNPTSEFEAHTIEACADLIRRDRNHASVIAWECSLNESDMPDEFIAALSDTVHKEYPGAYSAGWQKGFDIFVQARQHRLQHYETPDQPYIVSEYGDWEYYAQNAGLNQESWQGLQENERTSRQLLNSGEKRLLQQATNLQEAHNDNFTVPAFADGYWVMFDYNRGYADDIESSGIASIYRQPKYSYYFYQSQRDSTEQDDRFSSGPMVHIASDWQPESSSQVRVYSNAEQVSLYLNDTLVATQTPDNDALSSHLAHPPFTFTLAEFTPGTLRADAVINGEVVASHTVATAGEATGIVLRVDESGKSLATGVKDKVFVYAQLIDAHGNPVRTNNRPLSATVSGDIQLLNQGPVTTSRGEGALLIQIGKDLSDAEVTVTGDGLVPATLALK